MDAPSNPPPPLPPTPPRPLGWTFIIVLLAPFAPILLSVLSGLASGHSKDAVAPWVFLFLALPVMLGCSIACSIQVGTRKGVGLGILTFFGTQILYLSAAFAGCVASIDHIDFR